MDERFEFGTRAEYEAAAQCGDFAAGGSFNLTAMPAPEEVDAAWCLRCGICQERCPAAAIERR